MDTKNTTLDDIAAEIGLTATIRLSAWFGDNRCYVPTTVEEDQLIVRLIGLSAARKLTRAFPGDTLSIPPLTQYESDLQRFQIGRMLVKGFSTREIANIVRMTERRVQQICRELEMAGLIPPIGPSKKGPRKVEGKSSPGKDARKNTGQKVGGKSAALPAMRMHR